MSANFKIILIGDEGVGKTSVVKRIHHDSFNKKYIPTMGVESTPLPFDTSRGEVVFNVWDCAGKEYYPREYYYKGAQAAVIMFDLTSQKSYESVSSRYKSVCEICPLIPIAICGNKVDLCTKKSNPLKRVVTANDVRSQYKNIEYFEISSKSNCNLKQPFLYLAKTLFGDFKFVQALGGNSLSRLVLDESSEAKVSKSQITKWIESENKSDSDSESKYDD